VLWGAGIRRNQTRYRPDQAPGDYMTDYRRGVELNRADIVWQKVWHYSQACEDFPTRNFAVRQDRPSDDDLCHRCHSRNRDS